MTAITISPMTICPILRSIMPMSWPLALHITKAL